MALVVEDGTGLPNAESYASLAFANEYHTNMGNTWDGTDASKEAWLRQGTRYIEGKYRDRFPGTKGSKEQALYFPVVNGVDADGFEIEEDEIPLSLQIAVSEAALAASQGSLFTPLERGGMVKRERVEGAVEVEYMDGALSETQYPAIEHAIRGLVGVNGGRFLLRAGG